MPNTKDHHRDEEENLLGLIANTDGRTQETASRRVPHESVSHGRMSGEDLDHIPETPLSTLRGSPMMEPVSQPPVSLPRYSTAIPMAKSPGGQSPMGYSPSLGRAAVHQIDLRRLADYLLVDTAELAHSLCRSAITEHTLQPPPTEAVQQSLVLQHSLSQPDTTGTPAFLLPESMGYHVPGIDTLSLGTTPGFTMSVRRVPATLDRIEEQPLVAQSFVEPGALERLLDGSAPHVHPPQVDSVTKDNRPVYISTDADGVMLTVPPTAHWEDRRESWLPDQVKDIEIEQVADEGKTGSKVLRIIVHYTRPLAAWMLALGGLISYSVIGGVMDKLNDKGVNTSFTGLWRVLLPLAVLLPGMAIDIISGGWKRPEAREILTTPRGVALILACGLTLSAVNICFEFALKITSFLECYVFASLHPILLLCLPSNTKHNRGEWIGALIGLAGVAMIFVAGLSLEGNTIQGMVLSFCISLFYTPFLRISPRAKHALPFHTFFFFMFFINVVTHAVVFFIKGGRAEDILPIPPKYDWTTFLQAMIVGFCGGYFGIGGLIVATRWLSSVVISVMITTEPVISTILAYFMGAESIPSPLACAGGAVMTLGSIVLCMSAGGQEKKVEVELPGEVQAPPINSYDYIET